MLYTIAFILIFIYIGFSIFYYRGKQQFPNITGPHPLPVIGNALPLAFKPVHYALTEITRQWGSIFLMWLGTKPIVILNEPELIKNVLQTNSASFRKGFFSDIVKPLMGDGLLTSEGEMWKLHHKLANSGFQASRYKESIPLIADRVFALLTKWNNTYIANSTPVDIYSEFSRLTLDNIGIAAFGGDFGAINSDDSCIFDEVAIILKEMQKRAEQLYPVYKLYPSFLTKKFDTSNDKIHSIVRKKINNRKNCGDTKKCLLDTMLEAQHIYNMTDKEIEDEMITWVMGGHETTASLISWTFYLLCKNRECLKKVKEEINNLNIVNVPSYDDLNKMEYLTCVLKETLRMFPPAPLLNRVSVESVDIGGYVLPPNTEVLICPWALHYDDQYFENSKKFQPERFKEDKYGYAYLPFGGGPRACLGKLFAFFEAKLVISIIVQSVDLQLVSKEEIDSEVAITLRPRNGIVCKVTKV